MTRCDEVRAWMLEADTDALAPDGRGATADHLRACTECAAVARRLLAGQAALDHALGRMASRVAQDIEPRRVRDRVERRRWRRRRVAWGVVAPLAAAAAVVLALFQAAPWTSRDPGDPLGTTPAWAVPGLSTGGARPVVRANAERVAVLPTRDPDITVVWFIR